MPALKRPEFQEGDKCTVNIVPCRIHHDGPTRVTKRYWNPVYDQKESTRTSQFRGRKLRGRLLRVPEGYEGVVVKSTDETLHTQPQLPSRGPTYTAIDDDLEIADHEEEDDDEPQEPVKLLKEMATFDDVVVWGHDHVPSGDDPFVKGLSEWIAFAENIHGVGKTVDTGKSEKSNEGHEIQSKS